MSPTDVVARAYARAIVRAVRMEEARTMAAKENAGECLVHTAGEAIGSSHANDNDLGGDCSISRAGGKRGDG